jgi:hypothetical protein
MTLRKQKIILKKPSELVSQNLTSFPPTNHIKEKKFYPYDDYMKADYESMPIVENEHCVQ